MSYNDYKGFLKEGSVLSLMPEVSYQTGKQDIYVGRGSTEYLLLFKVLIKIVSACLVIIILGFRLSSIDSKIPINLV